MVMMIESCVSLVPNGHVWVTRMDEYDLKPSVKFNYNRNVIKQNYLNNTVLLCRHAGNGVPQHKSLLLPA